MLTDKQMHFAWSQIIVAMYEIKINKDQIKATLRNGKFSKEDLCTKKSGNMT